MERSFESIRLGVNRIADCWARSSRALKKEDQKYGEKLAKLAKMYSRGSFFGCEDPLEQYYFQSSSKSSNVRKIRGGHGKYLTMNTRRRGVLSLKYRT
jgi:hypothetical protein